MRFGSPNAVVATVEGMVTARRFIVHIKFGSHNLEYTLDTISITGECPPSLIYSRGRVRRPKLDTIPGDVTMETRLSISPQTVGEK